MTALPCLFSVRREWTSKTREDPKADTPSPQSPRPWTHEDTETFEIAQTFAKVDLFASQRIGELLRELPTRQGKRTDLTSIPAGTEVTKAQAIESAGIAPKQATDLQALAANPEVVQAVIERAEAEGRLVSRKQVIDAISEKKRAEQQRDEALDELEEAYHSAELMEAEVASLRRQVAEKPQPEVVEREVVPSATLSTGARVACLLTFYRSRKSNALRRCAGSIGPNFVGRDRHSYPTAGARVACASSTTVEKAPNATRARVELISHCTKCCAK